MKLVISDAHERLKAAIRRVFDAGWQRCRVHWMCNTLAYVLKFQQSMVAAALRQAFLQPDRAQASAMLRHVADLLGPKWPKLAAFIDDREIDVLSYLDRPEQHRSKLHSTDEIDKPFSADFASGYLLTEGSLAPLHLAALRLGSRGCQASEAYH